MRSRLVATEINSCAREDVCQSTLPIKCSRLILLLASSRTQTPCHVRREGGLLPRYSFWQDRSDPAEEKSGKRLLLVSAEGHAWHQRGEQVLGQHSHRHAWQPTKMTRIALDHLDRVLGEAFDVKVLPRTGPQGFVGQAVEGNHLGRTMPQTPRGFTWWGHPQHVADFISIMGLGSESRSSSTPAFKATGKNVRNAMDVLPNEPAELFRDSFVHCHRQATCAVCNARDDVWHVRSRPQ